MKYVIIIDMHFSITITITIIITIIVIIIVIIITISIIITITYQQELLSYQMTYYHSAYSITDNKDPLLQVTDHDYLSQQLAPYQ